MISANKMFRPRVSSLIHRSFSQFINAPIRECDPELWEIIKKEKKYQKEGLYLIASENFTSKSVLECLGSCLTNKYSEGYPHDRYYGGNFFIDQVEDLAKNRLLALYGLKSPETPFKEADWGVNVQPYSGSPANFAVYTGLLKPHDRIMGLDLPDGGHLTHGFYTKSRRVSSTSIYFESLPYKINKKTQLIDYDELEKMAKVFMPKLIIAGVSGYTRLLDYERFRKICDSIGAILLADMAHVSGLVAAKAIPSPFEWADVVTSTTHKTLRGPRSGMIFFRRKRRENSVPLYVNAEDYENLINTALFPGLQGGPHQNSIAGVANMALIASSEPFQNYIKQVISNSKRLAETLSDMGYSIVGGSTDIHFSLIDLVSSKKPGIERGDGAKTQLIADQASIILNKNTVPGDLSAMKPSGLRLGTPSMTTRGLVEKDFEQVAVFVDRLVDLTLFAKQRAKDYKTFKGTIKKDAQLIDKIKELSADVKSFTSKFPMPGHDEY